MNTIGIVLLVILFLAVISVIVVIIIYRNYMKKRQALVAKGMPEDTGYYYKWNKEQEKD